MPSLPLSRSPTPAEGDGLAGDGAELVVVDDVGAETRPNVEGVAYGQLQAEFGEYAGAEAVVSVAVVAGDAHG